MQANASTAAAGLPFPELVPRKAVLPNGVELHYVRAGQGAPLVFIHGAMGDWRSFEAQWQAFTPHYDCVTYSRRFSFPNENAKPSPDHSALDEAEDLALLLDALGWRRAILVGSSYGGFTALALAVRAPERVQAVVAVEPPMMKYAALSPEGKDAEQRFRRDVIAPANAAFRAGDDERAAQIMTGGINGAKNSFTADPEAMRRRMQNVGAMKALALSSDEFPLLAPEKLAALPMPVFLLSGERTAPVHAAVFANVCTAMPRAERRRVANAGHGVSREQPEVFNKAVLAFLERSVR